MKKILFLGLLSLSLNAQDVEVSYKEMDEATRAAEKKINFSFNVANFSKIKEHYVAFITQQLSQMEALQSEIAIHSRLIEELKSTISFEIAKLKVRLEEVNKIEKDYNVE